MNEDWLKISLEFSVCSLQEPETAEDNIMRLLLEQINNLLQVTGRKPRRICTLHNIIGNQVHFHRTSDLSAERDNKIRSISDGLIGRAIQEKNNVTIFRNAREQEGFILGWEDCQSELIGLIKDGTGKPTGVVNLESNYPDDFFCDEDPNIDHKRGYLRQRLEQIVRIASNHLSLIFKHHISIREKRSSSSLIEELSRSPISSIARLQEVIEFTFAWLKERTELSRAVFYITDLEGKNRYVKAAKYGRMKTLSEITPNAQEIKPLFELGVHNITKAKVTKVFGEDFSDSFAGNVGGGNIYFSASEIEDIQKSMSIKYFVGVIIDRNYSGSIVDQVRSCFKVSKNATTRYLNNKANEYTKLLNKTTIKMYRTTLQEGNFRTTLNYIATSIANQASARFCFIYLVAPEEYYHSRHKFYLGGAGKGEVNFADIRFNQETDVAAYVLKNKQIYYHRSFYDCDINGHVLDPYLRDKGLEKPEVYAYPLLQKQSDTEIGAILLLRENLDITAGQNNPNIGQVNTMLSVWSNHLSGIIYTERQKQASFILSDTYEKLVGIVPYTMETSNSHQFIVSLQDQITRQVLPLWNEILNPAYFVVYKRYDRGFELFDKSVLGKNVDSEPPIFVRGQGLTGSVVDRESQEIYEPFVEDFDISRGLSTANHSAPDAVCKSFWDKVLGDKRRMYYGKYIGIGKEEYVLLIVGVRKSKFLPTLGYKLAHDLTDTVCTYLKSSVRLG